MADSQRPPAPPCAKDPIKGYPCTICGETGYLMCPCHTKYCSKECQTVDWRDHKAICEKKRAKREEKAKRSEAPTPPSSPTPERLVFYGPEERTRADEERARIDEAESARARHEANPEPEPLSARFGNRCPICLDVWDVNAVKKIHACCCRRTCKTCADGIGTAPCPHCGEPQPTNDAEALAMLRRHADMDIPEALTQLGVCYRKGRYGLVKSEKKAARLYERAAELGDVEAITALGSAYQFGEGVKLDEKEAWRYFRLAADRGHAGAQCNLGDLLRAAGDFGEAARLLGLAAAQGWTEAQYDFGFCHWNGQGVPKNLDEAERLFRLAAAKGNESAKISLAHLLDSKRP